MEAAVITAVGIDVSKSKSTVAVRRPGGEIVLRPFDVRHTNSDLKKLASTLKKLGGDIRIVMEHTSTYWRPIALTLKETSVYKGYKQDKIEMRGDRAEMSDFPLYLNTVAGGLDRRDQAISGFSFVVKIYAVPVVEIIG